VNLIERVAQRFGGFTPIRMDTERINTSPPLRSKTVPSQRDHDRSQ